MAHATNNNPSLAVDSSLSGAKFIEMVKHIIIDVPVLEDLNLCDCSIYKVPCNLRKVKEEAYTPMFISIGPIHFDKEELKPMQKHKLWYLEIFLIRILDEQAMEQYKHYLEAEEEEIRRCYAEKFPHISKEKFIEMILLDAVFIMELFLGNCEWKSNSRIHDFFLRQSLRSRSIARDLILLENQIPFFVLEKLYDDVVPYEEKGENTRFVDLAIEYFALYNTQMSYPYEAKEISLESPKHFTDLTRCFYISPELRSHRIRRRHVLKTATTKLRDSGVSIEKSDAKKPLLEITFEKTPILSLFLCFGCFPCLKPFEARLKIPQLRVDDITECVFRNLIAFELCHDPEKPYICNYVSLIDSLIHTKVDVDMLVEKEVLVLELGSHQEVETLFNGLCKHAVTNPTYYYNVIEDLNKHYSSKWNHTVAALRLVYFRDLWRASSTVAGIVVLVFTVFQLVSG